MAIVKMRRLRVIAMAAQREELLQGLLHLGCVEISEPEERLSDPEWAALLRRSTPDLAKTRTEIADANTALDAVKRYSSTKDGLFIRRRSVSETEFLNDFTQETGREITGRIKGLLQELARLQNEEGRLNARRAALLPWKDLDLPLEMEGTVHTTVRKAVCPAGTDLGVLRNELDAAGVLAEVQEVSEDRHQIYAVIICHRADETALQDYLRPRNFSVVTFPGLTGTAGENVAALDGTLAENRKRQEEITAALSQTDASRDALRLYADRLTTEAARQTGWSNLLTDGIILFFEGWSPEENIVEVRRFLDELGCAWDDEDAAPEEKPPVRLKNNLLTNPLNMVTEMYSLPAYGSVDPNPLMAPFFILFYGIMMADMGYGLLMILAGVLITRKYRPKGTAGHLFGLLTLCGISTFFWGALTGGFFGDFLTQAVKLATGGDFTLPSLFTPLHDTLMILIGSMCLGFVHINVGMAVSFVMKLRRGQTLEAVTEEVTWWVVFAGLALMILNVTPLVLYLGLAMVLAGPIATGEGFGKITGIFGSLYSHVTGYFGDILSYSRLMALMLAGSVIAQVFNTLGAIPGNILIFLVISMAGNALNFALNLLGCYVHDLRLQCLEYFGKFYEDGGRPFQPLAMNTKFVDIETT